MKNEEHKIQVGCYNWFRIQYPKMAGLLRAIPNGGKRDAITGAFLKAEGVQPGTADLMLLIPKKGFASLQIEMKTPKGKQSESQKEYERLVTSVGHKYIVCRSIDQFIKEIKEYLE